MSEGPALRLHLEAFGRYYHLWFEVCFDEEMEDGDCLVLLMTHHSALITFLSDLCLIG